MNKTERIFKIEQLIAARWLLSFRELLMDSLDLSPDVEALAQQELRQRAAALTAASEPYGS